jgi:transposase InsO family protein
MYSSEFSNDKPIGRDSFCTLLNDNGMKLRLRIRKPRTTDSTHGLPTYPNLIKDFIPTAANQLWVSDITYIVVMENMHIQAKMV